VLFKTKKRCNRLFPGVFLVPGFLLSADVLPLKYCGGPLSSGGLNHTCEGEHTGTAAAQYLNAALEMRRVLRDQYGVSLTSRADAKLAEIIVSTGYANAMNNKIMEECSKTKNRNISCPNHLANASGSAAARIS
jgi:hypothetical protein